MLIRPVPFVTLAFALGIAAADRGIPAHPAPLVGALILSLVICGRQTRLVGLRPLGRAFAAFVFSAAAGQLAFQSRAAPVLSALPKETVRCRGYVTSTRQVFSGRSEIRMRRAACRSPSDMVRLGVVVYAAKPPPPRGALVSITGTLRAPAGFRNPGEADRARQERRAGYSAVLQPSPGQSAHVLRSPAPVLHPLPSLRGVLRGRVAERYPAAVRPLMLALLTGDTSTIPDGVRSDFRRAGLSHLLAVSGLHVGIIAGVVLLAVTSFLARLSLAPAARSIIISLSVAVLLLGLVAVTGPRPSVVRATLMGSLLLARRASQRSGRGLRDVMAVAMLLQLAISPASLYQPGFQLSYAAILGLSMVRRNRGWLRASVSASAAATLATAPFVAFHFGPVPLAGIATNLAGIPLAGVVVISGLLGLLPGATPVSVAAGTAARLLMDLATGGADSLWWVQVIVPPARLPEIGLAALAACSLVRSFRGRYPVVAAVVVTMLLPAGDNLLRVVFLDVGQGDAAVLHLPGGRTAVVDTGTPYGSAVTRYLARVGIDRVEHVVITHDHADHAGGLRSLLGAVDVNRLIAPGPLDTGDVHIAAAGDTLDFGPGLRIYVLSPRSTGDGNKSSLALVIRYGSTQLLMMGDAEEHAEREIIATWPALLRSDVIKVGHHGSRTSSTRALVLRAVRGGSIAVVSVGAGNRYGHPDERVVGRLQGAGAAVRFTSRQGAVCVISDGVRFEEGCP